MDPTCASCGARMPLGAAWCSLCFTRVTAAGGPAVTPEEGAARPRWVPDARFIDAPAPPVYSRVKGGALTFGLKGRIALSVLALLVYPYLALLLGGPGGFGLIFVSAVPIGWFLRDVWRKDRVS